MLDRDKSYLISGGDQKGLAAAGLKAEQVSVR